MAVITNTFLTYDSVGNREKLEDIIYRIDPEETPVLSMARRGSTDATYHEWQEDALRAPNAANAHLQGDDVDSFDAIVPTDRLGNRTQIVREQLVISETEEVIRKAGRKSEIGYQKAKKAAELKLDVEAILCANQAAVVGGTAVAPKMGSILSFLQTNTDFNAVDGADPVTKVTTARTDGTPRAFTVDMVKAVMQSCYTEGAKPKILLVGAHNRSVASGFAGVASHVTNADKATPTIIVGSASVYVSDFGNLVIRPSRLIRGRDALFLDPEYLEVLYLRPFKWVKLAKTGDNEKEFLRAELTLKIGAEKAHGGAFDLTSS